METHDRRRAALRPVTWFVDESKSRGYHLVAIEAADSDVAGLRREVRALLRPGQRRLHFTRESESSRRSLSGALARLPVRAHVASIRGVDDKTARKRCLDHLVRSAAASGIRRIVLERDASIEAADRRMLGAAIRAAGASDLRYEHADAREEPLLWVADAVAWAQQAGGAWPRRFAPLVSATSRLDRSGA